MFILFVKLISITIQQTIIVAYLVLFYYFINKVIEYY